MVVRPDLVAAGSLSSVASRAPFRAKFSNILREDPSLSAARWNGTTHATPKGYARLPNRKNQRNRFDFGGLLLDNLRHGASNKDTAKAGQHYPRPLT